jgi:TPR repeat protein
MFHEGEIMRNTIVRRFIVRTITLAAFLLFGVAWDAHAASSSQPITWSPQCPQGSAEAEALYQLGLDYQKSRNGKIQDLTQAAVHFEKAIQGGNAKAALAYGLMLRTSKPFGERHVLLPLSVDFYKLGAAMQCPEGLHMLADAYDNGWGVRRNPKQAVKLVRRAAEMGSLVSMVACAEIEPEKEIYWLEKALDGGYGYAGYPLSLVYFIRMKDAEKGIAVLRRGAALGSSDCLFSLQEIYRNAEYGQEKDPEYAERIYALYESIDEEYEPKPIPDFGVRLPPKPVLPYKR